MRTPLFLAALDSANLHKLRYSCPRLCLDHPLVVLLSPGVELTAIIWVASRLSDTVSMIGKFMLLFLVAPYFLAYSTFKEIGRRHSLLHNMRLLLYALLQLGVAGAILLLIYRAFR